MNNHGRQQDDEADWQGRTDALKIKHNAKKRSTKSHKNESELFLRK